MSCEAQKLNDNKFVKFLQSARNSDFRTSGHSFQYKRDSVVQYGILVYETACKTHMEKIDA